MIVVLIHHDVDGGYEGTQLFETKAGAERWLRENGYRPDGPNVDTWMKPVYSEWDAEEYIHSPGAFEMEIAEVYEQEVRP